MSGPMLAIAAIDLIEGQCVRLYRGEYGRQTNYAAEPEPQALRFEQAGFPRLHVVDLDGARTGSGQNRRVIGQIVEAVKIPVQVGGGIRHRRDVAELLELGASYLIVGSVALEEPDEVQGWIREWGPEPFMISLDLQAGRLKSRGWRRTSEVSLDEMLARISRWGVTQIVCTDIDRDGTLECPNYHTLAKVLAGLPSTVRLIAAGGVSQPTHVTRLREMGLGGAVIGRALYEGPFSPEEFADAGKADHPLS